MSTWDPADAGRLRRVAEGLRAVADRAALLAPRERAMVQMVLRRGCSMAEVSRLMGVRPRTLGRRLERLIRTLRGKRYEFVASQIGRWTGPRRRVAQEVVLHGRSQRRAASELGMPVHEVRREMIAIEAMVEGAGM